MFRKPFFLFLYALSFFLFAPIFVSVNLYYFAPFIVFCSYNLSRSKAAFWTFLSGLLVDLFSTDTPLGMHSLCYCLTIHIFYYLKFHLFEDKSTTLPFLTFAFSSISTFLEACLFELFNFSFHYSWAWALEDLVIFPFYDALYACVVFVIPFKLIEISQKFMMRNMRINNR